MFHRSLLLLALTCAWVSQFNQIQQWSNMTSRRYFGWKRFCYGNQTALWMRPFRYNIECWISSAQDAVRISAARVLMDVDSAAAKGPSTTEGAAPIPRELANNILAAIPLLPDDWLLAQVDLILQNTDKYYMAWRRTFDEKSAVAGLRANTISLVEHLVEFLSEWIVTFVEPA